MITVKNIAYSLINQCRVRIKRCKLSFAYKITYLQLFSDFIFISVYQNNKPKQSFFLDLESGTLKPQLEKKGSCFAGRSIFLNGYYVFCVLLMPWFVFHLP